MAGRFSIEAIFKAVDRITAPVSRMQNRIGKFSRATERVLRNINRPMSKFIRSIGNGITRLAKLGAALGAAGFAAVATALQKTADAADKLAKQARLLDFPIQDLQEWKFVAEQSGIATSLFDSSMGAFTKRLGEAAGGAGPLVSGLKNINPELLKTLQGTESVSEAFSIYIEAMRNAKSATELAALSNAAFSRSGLVMGNISKNSASAIAAMRIEQRENGNITMQQAEAAEAYNDAVNSLKRTLKGFMQAVLLPMTPALTKTLRRWREWLVANKEMVQTRIIAFFGKVKEAVLTLAEAAVKFAKDYDIAERIGAAMDTLGAFARILDGNSGFIIKLIGGVFALSLVLKALAGVMALVSGAMALNPVILVVGALTAAVAALIWKWDDVKEAVSGFIRGTIAVLSGFTGMIGDMFSSAVSAVGAGISGLFSALKSVWAGLTGFAEPVIAMLAEIIPQPVITAFTALTAPVRTVIELAGVFSDSWRESGSAFKAVTAVITASFETAGKRIRAIIDGIIGLISKLKNFGSGIIDKFSGLKSKAFSFFGGGDDDDKKKKEEAQRPIVYSPQERAARSIEERREKSTAEVTIRDETGRAQLTRGKLGNGLQMRNTGAF